MTDVGEAAINDGDGGGVGVRAPVAQQMAVSPKGQGHDLSYFAVPGGGRPI